MVHDSIEFLHANFTYIALFILLFVLFLTFLLLLRRFGAEQQVHRGAAKSGVAADVPTEGALKKLFEEIQQGGAPRGVATPVQFEELSTKDQKRLIKEAELRVNVASSGDDGEALKEELEAQQEHIQKLQAEIRVLKEKNQKQGESPSGGGSRSQCSRV